MKRTLRIALLVLAGFGTACPVIAHQDDAVTMLGDENALETQENTQRAEQERRKIEDYNEVCVLVSLASFGISAMVTLLPLHSDTLPWGSTIISLERATIRRIGLFLGAPIAALLSWSMAYKARNGKMIEMIEALFAGIAGGIAVSSGVGIGSELEWISHFLKTKTTS